MAVHRVLLALIATARPAPSAASSPSPLPLWVVNVSGIPSNLLPLFATAQGVVNRRSGVARVLVVGNSADADKLTGADAAALSLDFLRSHYQAQLAYADTRVLADPWALFAQDFAKSAVTHAVLCDANDAPHALYAALTLAAANGGAAAVCVGSGAERSMVLEKSGLRILSDLGGRWPAAQFNGSAACLSVNAFIDAQLREGIGAGNFSSSYFATWGAAFAGKPTQGFDFAIAERMVTLCMDATASDWREGAQQRLIARYPKLSFGFGWWTDEDSDITALSGKGLTWLGGGHNLALFSQLQQVEASPQPSTLSLPSVSPLASLAVFSFSQGDAASFDQKFVPMNLRARSAYNASQTVASRYPFSLMATPLDATVQPNIAAEIRHLQDAAGNQQWLLGKPYGYTSMSKLDDAGVLGEYLTKGRHAMERLGWVDIMLNEPPSAELNATVTRVLQLCANNNTDAVDDAAASEPWPRAVLLKHPLQYPWKPGAKIPGKGGATEIPEQRGPGYRKTVVLSDPAKAVADKETGDLDVAATVQVVLDSAQTRRLFWVFLDHQMTSQGLEQVLDVLAAHHTDKVAIVNLDQALRLCATDPSTRRCFEEARRTEDVTN